MAVTFQSLPTELLAYILEYLWLVRVPAEPLVTVRVARSISCGLRRVASVYPPWAARKDALSGRFLVPDPMGRIVEAVVCTETGAMVSLGVGKTLSANVLAPLGPVKQIVSGDSCFAVLLESGQLWIWLHSCPTEQYVPTRVLGGNYEQLACSEQALVATTRPGGRMESGAILLDWRSGKLVSTCLPAGRPVTAHTFYRSVDPELALEPSFALVGLGGVITLLTRKDERPRLVVETIGCGCRIGQFPTQTALRRDWECRRIVVPTHAKAHEFQDVGNGFALALSKGGVLLALAAPASLSNAPRAMTRDLSRALRVSTVAWGQRDIHGCHFLVLVLHDRGATLWAWNLTWYWWALKALDFQPRVRTCLQVMAFESKKSEWLVYDSTTIGRPPVSIEADDLALVRSSETTAEVAAASLLGSTVQIRLLLAEEPSQTTGFCDAVRQTCQGRKFDSIASVLTRELVATCPDGNAFFVRATGGLSTVVHLVRQCYGAIASGGSRKSARAVALAMFATR